MSTANVLLCNEDIAYFLLIVVGFTDITVFTFDINFSLIKMLYWLTKNNADDNPGDDEEMHCVLSRKQLEHAILRNFGGSDEIHPLEEFAACFTSDVCDEVRIVVR